MTKTTKKICLTAIGIALFVALSLCLQVLRNLPIGAVIALSTALGILGVKPFVEVLLYAQPMGLHIAQNIYAFVADAAVLLLSLPICVGLKPVIRKLVPEEV